MRPKPKAPRSKRGLTHVSPSGEVRMVDVSAKPETVRRAVAAAIVHMKAETLALALGGRAKKGDVLATARIAGISAAKRTWELVPLCHSLMLSRVAVDIAPRGETSLEVKCTASATGRTGVEMEALTGASVAALTLYDMLKAVDRGMSFEVFLDEKSGGASGTWRRGS